MSLPPELRVLCQQLTSPSTSPACLTQSLKALTNHILQCAGPLSAPQDQKLRDSSSESTVLVHKLKNVLKTLLNDRDHRRRFAGVVLVKAVVDVGGWECLRSSEPWVRGLLAVLQKKDPIVSKELAVVTLTSIYTKLHGYQTLVREIATPTIPPFITACLQLLKASPADEPLRTPLTVVGTITDALATLIPLYPTTTRPSVNQIRSAIRTYLAPTISDDLTIPQTLQSSSRRLAIALHFTAPKAGGADEWSALLRRTVKDFHATADQVFRAVQETWEPPAGYTPSKISFGEAPHGGGETPDAAPAWMGITAGSQRLSGLLAFMADFLRHPTKAQVSIPVGALVDTVCRVAQIARHSPRTQTWEQSLELNPSVSRDERDELWSCVPEVHVAALELLLTLCRRLRGNFVPLVPEAADYLVRIFKSGIASAGVRRAGYELLAEVLPLCGPGMTKESVASLELILCACCRDIQESGGFLRAENKPAAGAQAVAGAKKNGIAMNADLFLAQKSTETSSSAQTLDPSHLQAAETLLSSLLEHLPQRHLKPASRGLLDQTAILSGSKAAMLASVLNPYRNLQGRMYPSIMPFLAQMHPRDQGLEVLRSNMRSSLPAEGNGLSVLKKVAVGEEAADEDVEMESPPVLDAEAEERERVADELEVSPPVDDATFKPVPVVDEGPKQNPFAPRKREESPAEEISVMASRESPSPPSPPQQHAHKRKIVEEEEQEDIQPAKKVDRKTPVEDVIVVQQDDDPAEGGEDDDSDDESVQLVASFDSDPDSDME